MKNYPYGHGSVKWISTNWLRENMLDEHLMIIDAQPNVHDYITEHIPNAVYLNPSLFRIPLNGLPAQYIPEKAMQQLFRRIGLTNDKSVVVYTGVGPFKNWGDGLEQSMVAYTLARFGINTIYVLDGGIDKWKDENKPLVQEFPDIKKSEFTFNVHEDYFIEYDIFKEIKDNDDVILLDARPADVYEGQGPWMKPGHIPGAINVPWKKFMTDDNTRLLKSDDEIQTILDKHNINEDKTIICSCGTGREATNEFLLFKWYLGFPKVKIYEGSFTEWSSYPDNPTTTGKEPR